MVAIGQADSSRSTLYFLDRDHMVEIAEPQPAPFLFDGDAVEAKRAHRGPQPVAREPAVGICFGGERGDLFVSEAAGGLAEDRRSTRRNSSNKCATRLPSSA